MSSPDGNAAATHANAAVREYERGCVRAETTLFLPILTEGQIRPPICAIRTRMAIWALNAAVYIAMSCASFDEKDSLKDLAMPACHINPFTPSGICAAG